MQVREDEVVSAIRWRLGLPVDASVARHQEIWERLIRSTDPSDRQLIDRVCRFLAEWMERAVRLKLGMLSPAPGAEDAALLSSLWESFGNWLKSDEARRSPRVSGLIKDAVTGRKSAPAQATPNSSAARRPAPTATPSPAPAAQTARMPIPPPPAPAEPSQAPLTEPPASGNPMPPTDPVRPRPTGPQWLYRPVPAGEPDQLPEYDALSLRTTDGSDVIGARVRGKKHKHEGTNCDDWFEVQTEGAWTVIAVADGAGSRRFLRVGAQASCKQAAEVLAGQLTELRISNRPALDFLEVKDPIQGTFVDEEVESVQRSLHKAFLAASFALESQVKDRQGSTAHQRLLGRPLSVDDLSATLLVAAHTTLLVGGVEQHLVLTCQVGDGVVAAIDPAGGVRVLGRPDSGDYSGETDFLTSRKQLEIPNLQRKTFALAGPLRALMVMTDGVADDYFPADPGMARLYADLFLNGVLGTEDEPVAPPALKFNPADGRLDSEGEYATADGPVRVTLRSAATYASELGISPQQLAADQSLLRAAVHATPLLTFAPTPAERLKLWLDAYQVRGSFDDRTLVVLHRPRAR